MAISEGMIEFVKAGINWIIEKAGKQDTSKKEMQIKIGDLEKEILRLSEGNRALAENMTLITSAVIAQLKENSGYTINVDIDTITLTGVNNGNVQTENRQIEMESHNTINEGSNIISNIENGDNDDEPFFVTDEDIARARIENRYKK